LPPTGPRDRSEDQEAKLKLLALRRRKKVKIYNDFHPLTP